MRHPASKWRFYTRRGRAPCPVRGRPHLLALVEIRREVLAQDPMERPALGIPWARVLPLAIATPRAHRARRPRYDAPRVFARLVAVSPARPCASTDGRASTRGMT